MGLRMESYILNKTKGENTHTQPQGEMLSIPNYYRRNANQNDKKSHPTCQNGHPHKITNITCRWEMGEEELSNMVSGKEHWTQPLERTASPCQKKNFLESSSEYLAFPQVGLYPREIIIQKYTCTPNLWQHCFQKTKYGSNQQGNWHRPGQHDVVHTYKGKAQACLLYTSDAADD